MDEKLVYQLPLSQGLNIGDIKFIDEGKNVLCFTGKSENDEFFVCVNAGKAPAEIKLDPKYETVFCNNVDFKSDRICLVGYGYVIAKLRG